MRSIAERIAEAAQEKHPNKCQGIWWEYGEGESDGEGGSESESETESESE